MNKPKPAPRKLEVVESAVGYWHYHLRVIGERRPLCETERPMMYTAMSLDQWMISFGEHFPKRPTWCKECEKLRQAWELVK